MSRIEDLTDRVERLLVRHEELQRTYGLLHEQLAVVSGERDNLRSRLSAARSRIDVLLDRLPRDGGAAVVTRAGPVVGPVGLEKQEQPVPSLDESRAA